MGARIPQRSATRGSTRVLPSDRAPATAPKAAQFLEVGIDTDGARPHRPRNAAEKTAHEQQQTAARWALAGIVCADHGVDPARGLAGNDPAALRAARAARDELLTILGLDLGQPQLCRRPGCGKRAVEHRADGAVS